MEWPVDAVLNWLWQGVVVAGAAAAMLRLLDRSRAAVRCVVCWIALLIVMALPVIPLAMASLPADVSTISTVPTEPIIVVPDVWWTSALFVTGLWAIWVGIHVVRIVAAFIVVRRTRAQSQPFPAAIAASLSYWQRLRGAGRPARLVLSDRVRAAAVLGGGAPVIGVARTLVDRLDVHELDRIIVHEWAHVQRRDDLATVGRLIVRAVAGWHPAAWWLDRRLALEQELACDEMVVAVSGGAKSYASCLVKLASDRLSQPDVLLAAGAVSSAGIARRVMRLVTRRDFASSAWSRRAAGAVIAILFVLAAGIAPVRIVEATVAASVARVLQPVARVHHATAAVPPPEGERAEGPRSVRPPSAEVQLAAASVSQPIEPGAPAASAPAPAPTATVTEPAVMPATTSETAPVFEAAAPVIHSSMPIAASASLLQVDDHAQSAWTQATDAGVAIGRGSKKAGVATAGAFTRFAKKVAGSF